MLIRASLRTFVLMVLATFTVSCTSTDHLVFTTYTKVGLDMSATNVTPSGLMFGYKRFEGAIVPVDTGNEKPDMMSIFASLDLKNGWFQGISIFQVFGTGEAAKNAAKNPSVISGYIDSLRMKAERD